MLANNKKPPKADLRWPCTAIELLMGVGFLMILSIVMVLLQKFYPEGIKNPWLVIQPQNKLQWGSVTAVFSTHFFHDGWGHLLRNILEIWFFGIIAFSLAGYKKTLSAVGWGILFAGLALLIIDNPDNLPININTITFAFLGIIVQSAIRKGVLFILGLIILVSLAGKFMFLTIETVMGSAEIDIFWMSNFFGFIGGVMADLRSPIEAIHILYRKKLISGEQAEALLRQCSPVAYDESLNEKYSGNLTPQEHPRQKLKCPASTPESDTAGDATESDKFPAP